MYPDTFVVYDRIVSQDASYKKEWLLHTVNEPTLTGLSFTADCGKGRLFVSTLLPENAVIEKIGGPGKEYFSNGKN